MKTVADISTTSILLRPRMAWSPARLFEGGSKGVWFDPSDLSTLFQDSAGTVPVSADGDPVGRMLDKSGNGINAIQTAPATRPTWRTDGLLSWLEFDGVDDRVRMTAIPHTANTFGLCIGLSYAPGGTMFGSWKSFHADGNYIGLSHPTLTGEVDTTGAQLELNGAPAPASRNTLRQALLSPGIGIATGIPATAFAVNDWQFIGYSAPGSPAAKVFGYIEAESLTPTTLFYTRHWMAKRSGVAL